MDVEKLTEDQFSIVFEESCEAMVHLMADGMGSLAKETDFMFATFCFVEASSHLLANIFALHQTPAGFEEFVSELRTEIAKLQVEKENENG